MTLEDSVSDTVLKKTPEPQVLMNAGLCEVRSASGLVQPGAGDEKRTGQWMEGCDLGEAR